MALKDEWKKTGQELGDAVTGLGKSLVRTAKVGADMAQNWAEDRDPREGIPQPNVTNDGSWPEAGRRMGDALEQLGKTVLHTAKTGAKKVENWAEQDEKKE